jgi:hypothetical protein
MSEITDLTTRRALSLAKGFMTAYQHQRTAMRLAGRPSAELAPGDDGETLVADVAACLTIASSLPRAGLTATVLDRMRSVEGKAFSVLSGAAQAYYASEALRRDLGRNAAEPFRLLRAALPSS